MSATDFSGAKLMLLCGCNLLVYLRDNRDDIPFPGKWDLPGGGREGDETPEQCAARELKEEFNLDLDSAAIIWSRRYPSWRAGDADSWFFAANMDARDLERVRFGNEGQYWRLMQIAEFLASPDAISHHCERVRDFMKAQYDV